MITMASFMDVWGTLIARKPQRLICQGIIVGFLAVGLAHTQAHANGPQSQQSQETNSRTPQRLDATVLDPQSESLSPEERRLETYQMLALLGEIFSQVESRYVTDVNTKVLLEGAVQGMLSTLDPYSNYLDVSNYEALRDVTSGQYAGIGARIGQDGLITEVFFDSPAEKAGVRIGDIITTVDGQDISSLDLSGVIDLLRGPPETSVDVSIQRPGSSSGEFITLDVSIRRDQIRSHIVSIERLGNIGYVSLSSFSRNTDQQIARAFERLINADGPPLKGFVLDLRNNPGGLLEQALRVSDLFMETGEIVSIRNERSGDQKSIQHFYADAGDILDNAPMIVLINQGTASASEIVAGALVDQKRAELVGVRSFGKGAVQDIFDLGPQIGLPYSQIALKLTTRRYYTPSGLSIDQVGLTPNYIVSNDADDTSAESNDTDTGVGNAPSTLLSEGSGDLPARALGDRQLSFALRHLGYISEDSP